MLGAGKCGDFLVTKERLSGRSLKRQEKKGATLAGGVGVIALRPRTWWLAPARLVFRRAWLTAFRRAGAGIQQSWISLPRGRALMWRDGMSHAALPYRAGTRSGLRLGAFWEKGTASAVDSEKLTGPSWTPRKKTLTNQARTWLRTAENAKKH